jgi:hypothetical protein
MIIRIIGVATKNRPSRGDFVFSQIPKSGGEFRAGLVAAAFQNNPAGFAGHAGSKTVHSGALTLLGLIGSLWHNAKYCSRSFSVCQVNELYPLKINIFPQFYRYVANLWKT